MAGPIIVLTPALPSLPLHLPPLLLIAKCFECQAGGPGHADLHEAPIELRAGAVLQDVFSLPRSIPEPTRQSMKRCLSLGSADQCEQLNTPFIF